jgi:hypothetical protein
MKGPVQTTFEAVKIGQLFIWAGIVFAKDSKTTGYNMQVGRSQDFKANNTVETV